MAKNCSLSFAPLSSFFFLFQSCDQMTKKRILKVLFLYLFLKHSRGRDVFGCWQWAIWSQKKYGRYVRPKKTNQKVRCLEMIRYTSAQGSEVPTRPVNEKEVLVLLEKKIWFFVKLQIVDRATNKWKKDYVLHKIIVEFFKSK